MPSELWNNKRIKEIPTQIHQHCQYSATMYPDITDEKKDFSGNRTYNSSIFQPCMYARAYVRIETLRSCERIGKTVVSVGKKAHKVACEQAFGRAGHYKDLTETGNRARKVSGTQGISCAGNWQNPLPLTGSAHSHTVDTKHKTMKSVNRFV